MVPERIIDVTSCVKAESSQREKGVVFLMNCQLSLGWSEICLSNM